MPDKKEAISSDTPASNINIAAVNNGKLTAADLMSKYQQRVNNYNTMLSLMDDSQSKLFNLGVNLYDIQKRENDWSGYIGYALKLLCCCGYYYDYVSGKWDVCDTLENFTPDPNNSDDIQYQYNSYIRNTLYPRTVCSAIGISCWDITDADIDMAIVNKALSGEMQYGYCDMRVNFCGEQATTTPSITIPDIPVSSSINVDEMTKGDKSKDKFIYAFTDSGVSKNNRNWRPMIMDSIAQQVMDKCPPGNFGHMKPENVGFDLPLPVVTWIGATTELLPDGVTKRCWLKGYVIPTDAGNQLKLFIRAKAIDSISVFGGLILLPNEDTGIQTVLQCDLKSIDISGKLKQGLNSGIVKLAGEMSDITAPPIPLVNNMYTRKEHKEMPDLTSITLEQLKLNNPKLYGEMKAEVVAALNTENKNKELLIKAGEMDTLTTQYGNVKDTLETYKSFAGEIAGAMSIQQNGTTIPTLSDVINAVKAQVTQLKDVTTALNPADNQTVVDKANEVALQAKLANNANAITTVQNKFAELTKDVTNDAVKNLVSMQFSGILNAKPEEVADDFATTSVAKLEAEVPTVIQNVTTQAQALLQAGQVAGEMGVFDNLGLGKGTNSQGKDPSTMTDEEYATSLGY